MKRIFMLYAVVIVSSISFINCSDETTPGSNTDPEGHITNPTFDASFLEGEIIHFNGSGTDREDGTIAEDALVWTSDMDGQIGIGMSISVSLSINKHRITLTVTDNDGNTASHPPSIIVHVISGTGLIEYEFVTVPATTGYPMGWVGVDADEEPVHMVSLDEFHIGKHEVSHALWVDVKTWAESNGYTFANNGHQGSWSVTSVDYQQPVTDIDWRDCIAWCNAYSEMKGLYPAYFTSSSRTEIYKNSATGGDLYNAYVDWNVNGYRLPTEAEWEYAARYIDGISVSSGERHSGRNLYPAIGDCVWYVSNSGYSTHPVGQLQANSLGTKDMNGNVWEWCWDWYGSYPSIAQNNPLGSNSGTYRVIRGGCYSSYAILLTTASRGGWFEPTYTYGTIGFRVCHGNLIP